MCLIYKIKKVIENSNNDNINEFPKRKCSSIVNKEIHGEFVVI